jgi:heat shock protein HslJ
MRTPSATLLLLATLACHSHGTDVASAGPTPLPVPATYAGTLPCADCPGIRLTLTLLPDGSYRLRQTYADRPGTFDETGRWEIQGDGAPTVVLRAAEGGRNGPRRFRVGGRDALLPLTLNGKPFPDSASTVLRREGSVDSSTTDGGRAEAATIEGVSWRLVGLADRPTLAEGVVPSLRLDPTTHRAGGDTGCNTFAGSYTLAGDTLRFGPLISSRRACLSDLTSAQETAYLDDLQRTRSWTLAGDTLRLADERGELMRLRK